MKKRIALSVGIPFLILLLLIPFWLPYVYENYAPYLPSVDPVLRTYKKFYHSIDIGMTRAEVMEQMNECYPTNGVRLPPEIMNNTSARLGFFANPEQENSSLNCEGIFLRMEDDKVVKKTYSPD